MYYKYKDLPKEEVYNKGIVELKNKLYSNLEYMSNQTSELSKMLQVRELLSAYAQFNKHMNVSHDLPTLYLSYVIMESVVNDLQCILILTGLLLRMLDGV